MRAAVTGGAGFIGHHVVRGLVAEGHEVVVVDDFSTGDRRRLEPIGADVRVVEGSVLDPAVLDASLPGCEVVFHEAAIASVARSVADPRAAEAVNTAGTIEVMRAAARLGVRRVVMAGTSAVYGVPDVLPCRETQAPDPRSPYGASKLAAEHFLHAMGRLDGVETVSLRYFNVYGPSQDPEAEYAAVVPRFITAILAGARPVINGSGEISRDFVFVEDVVRANLLAARPDRPTLLTANIASGTRTSLLDLLDAIGRAVGRDADPVFGPARAGDIPHSQADVALARSQLGFEAQVSLMEGIARTVDWYRDAAT